MENDEKSISGIPISGALAVIALILGLLISPQVSFKASRPQNSEKISSALHEGEDVQSRLWQDPFSAVMTHKSAMAPNLHGHGITDLANQIIQIQKKEQEKEKVQKIMVLGVMVDGGPYAENVESRIRFRYAVLSALGEPDDFFYVPEDSEHIGYLENLCFIVYPYKSWLTALSCYGLFKSEAHESWFMDLVPYEWFESENSSQSVLVLWLNDNRFSGNPLRKLSDFTGLLNEAVKIKAKETNNKAPKLEYRILGPADSTNLKDIIREEDLEPKQQENLKDVRIFSWAATVDLEKLIPKEKGEKEAPNDLATVIEKMCAINGKKGLRFFRTIGPDKILTDLLVRELGLRITGMIPEKNNEKKKVHIALISEWDTVYGRNLPEAFVRSVAGIVENNDSADRELGPRIKGRTPGKNDEKKKVHMALIPVWDTVYGRNLHEDSVRSVAEIVENNDLKPDKIVYIHKFSYMRGIDGQVPGKTKVNTAITGVSNKKEAASEKQDIERPAGRSQFDYLRRLAFRLKELDEEILRNNEESGIQAIGVLGSDVYDKLLVLQAIYKMFPSVIFFTTDLDARLLHPDELLWTQNLVIASNFGLRLNKNLQKNVPPFRDNYQTSLFLTTKIALSGCELPPSKENKGLGSPRIFEVGRSGAFALGLKDGLQKEASFVCQKLAGSGGRIHPITPGYGHVWMHSIYMWWCFAAAICFAIFTLILYSRFWKRENVKGIDASIMYQLSPCFLILFLILIVAVMIVIIGPPFDPAVPEDKSIWPPEFLRAQFDAGEPFAFFEGISIWPSEFLRFLAWGLSLYFLITSFIKARISDNELYNRFFNPSSDHFVCVETDTAATGETDVPKTACSVWNEYKKYTTWKRRIFRILPLGVLYGGLCAFMIKMFGKPFVPYRGIVSYHVDKIALILAVVFFIVLLFWIVDFTTTSRWLIRRISQLDAIWPKGATRNISKKFNMNVSYLYEWIDIQVIVKISETAGRFVYYPFIVILILGASRLRYFDRWDMPLGLLIVIMLGLSYSVYCAASLRNTARKARVTILNKLWEKQMNLQAPDKEAISEQITMMYDAIRSMRKGAFCPFFEQPCVRAVALFLGGGGSLVALNYL